VNGIKRKVLLTLCIAGVVGAITGWATFSTFSATTVNSGNVFAAGTVVIGNNAGSALYNVSNKKPGDSVSACIKVTYTGSLDSTVKMYSSSVGALGPYLNLTVTPGTGNVTPPSCTNFSTAQSALYTGTLGSFASTYTSFSNGLTTNPPSATKWVTNDAVVYKFDLTLQDNNAANGGAGGAISTGSHSFTWEAQNQ
jgi:hypothetical protein